MAKPKPAPSPTGYLLTDARFDADYHAGKLTPWKPGDPVGCGDVYLPTSELRSAYAEECRRQQTEANALYVLDGATLAIRQARVRQLPVNLQAAVQVRVWEIWNERKAANDNKK